MSDYQMALQGCMADIAALEARARAVRDAWFSADHEANEDEAQQLDEDARGLRSSLAQLMRDRSDVAGDPDERLDDDEIERGLRDLRFA